jgi:phage-related protein
MTNLDYERFPPLLVPTLTGDPSKPVEPSSSLIRNLRTLAWLLYTSGTILQTVKDGLSKAKLSEAAITAISTVIDSYADLVNSANTFLASYVTAVISGKWPAVPIEMPPVIDPKAGISQQVLNDIKGAVNAAIVKFDGSAHGAEVANALSALEKGLEKVVKTIQQYYPGLLK